MQCLFCRINLNTAVYKKNKHLFFSVDKEYDMRIAQELVFKQKILDNKYYKAGLKKYIKNTVWGTLDNEQ